MEKEKIKELAKTISDTVFSGDNFTYDDMASLIIYLVGFIDSSSENTHNMQSGSSVEYVQEIINTVYYVFGNKPTWRPSTEHPQIDEEVIALVCENDMICFAHIVDKDKCIDYDGWNIPEVKWWIPCPKIPENDKNNNSKEDEGYEKFSPIFPDEFELSDQYNIYRFNNLKNETDDLK